MEELVVGVDGSPSSDAALRFAAEEAAAHGWRLVAVHTWSAVPVMSSPFGPVPYIDAAEVEAAAKDTLARALDRVLGPERDHKLTVESVVASGHAAHILLQRSVGARLLVVGKRGHGGFTGMLLGSVSQHCARHAKCPVVIVPAPSA
jgi:nucleotide-binding universal stress UspA family protein